MSPNLFGEHSACFHTEEDIYVEIFDNKVYKLKKHIDNLYNAISPGEIHIKFIAKRSKINLKIMRIAK